MIPVAVDLESDIQPVSDFRANTAETIRHVQETGRPLVLTQRGRSAVVVLDVGAYQALVDELAELRDVQQGLADVDAGRTISHAQALEDLQAEFKK